MKLTVAGASLNQTPLDWEGNCNRILDAIGNARNEGVDILCLPELCITGYGCEDLFLAPWVPRKAWTYLIEVLLPQTQAIGVAIGLPFVFEGKVYNIVAFCSDGQVNGLYAKQWLAKDGLHYEPRWFEAWTSGVVKDVMIEGQVYTLGDVLFTYKGVKVGIELCEEAWHGSSRTAIAHARRGAHVILNPSASHFALGKTEIRESLIRRTSDFFEGIYVYANLLGNEAGRVVYDGEILISHSGKIVARNAHFSFQDINLLTYSSAHEKNPVDIRYQEHPFEAFRRLQALGLFDYLRKSKNKAFALSLSGGADSSCCAVLVAEMVKEGLSQLGPNLFAAKLGQSIEITSQHQWVSKLLFTAYQSTENSGSTTKHAARELALQIGATHFEWDIQQGVDFAIKTLEKASGDTLIWETHDLALQNIQSRMRSPYIWLLANIKNALLLTTSNRSEGNVGYATMDGDTSGGLAPLAGIDKHYIRQWLLWAEHHLDYTSLSHVNTLEPTAELRPQKANQTDEKDLMPYAALVEIERLAIGLRMSPNEVFDTLQTHAMATEAQWKTYINLFFSMWARTQWKRERLAPSFHIDTFNIDPRSGYRFPILSAGFDALSEA